MGSAAEISTNGPEFKNISWRKTHMQLDKNQVLFKGSEELPNDLFQEFKTPYQCFRYFADEDLFKHIADQTNLYARQINISNKFQTSPQERQNYVGIMIYMSLYRYPNVREYWGENSFEPIRQAMSRNRFEEIRRYLHFNGNSKVVAKHHPEYDAAFKVTSYRPFQQTFPINTYEPAFMR